MTEDDRSWWAYAYEIKTSDGPGETFYTWSENPHYGASMAYDSIDLRFDLARPYERVSKLLEESDGRWAYVEFNLLMAVKCDTRQEAERMAAEWAMWRVSKCSA